MENDMFQQEPEETKKSDGRGRGIVWGILIALAVGNIFAIWQSSQTQTQLRELSSTIENRIAHMSEQTTSYSSRADRNAAMLKDQVEEAQQAAAAAATAADRAKKQAEQKAQQLVSQLADQYNTQHTALSDELGHVKDAATQANQGVVAVQTDVNSVRGDVQQTRSDLDSTRSDLKSVRGDMGVQSGLIATNAKELAALREMGERNYYEFNVPKDKVVHKIGDVAIMVRSVKPKQGRFTLDVIADDQRVQKKDRTINEPVQFYVSGARQPYELVVNKVQKDRLVGYLAVPKVLRAAR